jgi:hypothetical protein
MGERATTSYSDKTLCRDISASVAGSMAKHWHIFPVYLPSCHGMKMFTTHHQRDTAIPVKHAYGAVKVPCRHSYQSSITRVLPNLWSRWPRVPSRA